MADVKAQTKDANPKQDDFQPTAVPQKIVRINPMALISMFMTGNEIGVKEGIVAGTRYVGGGYDPMTNTFFMHVENDNFDEVTVGDKLPPVIIELVDLKQKNVDGTPKVTEESK